MRSEMPKDEAEQQTTSIRNDDESVFLVKFVERCFNLAIDSL